MERTRLPAFGGALLAVLVTALACGGGGGTSASFTGMGEGSGGLPIIARAISSDASTVVGGSGFVGDLGFHWFHGEMEPLQDFDGGEVRTWAEGISGDSRSIVGSGEYELGKTQAFLHIKQQGRQSTSFREDRFIGLGFLPGGDSSAAKAASNDGIVIVGQSESEAGPQAFRYTPSGKMVGLGFLPGGSAFSAAYALSTDGKVVVGESDSAQGVEAFIWNRTDKMVSLGTLSSTPHDVARAVSADGLIVAGGLATESSGENREAFIWTQVAGFQTLGDLPGGAFDSIAYALSADGTIAVGRSSTGANQHEAFIWDATQGMRNLRSFLAEEHGLDLEGWRLESAVAISADGQTIVGTGTNPEGKEESWIAVLQQ